jgi:formate hydrogenlyase transcriptional activator
MNEGNINQFFYSFISMIFSLLIIAILIAGISLALGVVSLASGLSKHGEKLDSIFGFMCISLFFFYMIPPVGFVLMDKAPFSDNIILKRAFNFLYAGLLPWFVLIYTGYKGKIFPIIISILYLASYFIMAFTQKESEKPLWISVLLISMFLFLFYGFRSVSFLYKSGEKPKSKWLLACLIINTILISLTLFNQLEDNLINKLLHTHVFYPINLFPLAFMLLMGIRLRTNSNERYRLLLLLGARDKKWDALLNNIQTFVLELDKEGTIRYINPFSVKLLGYEDVAELIGKNWFDCFIPTPDISIRKSRFKQMMLKEEMIVHHKNEIICRNGEKKIFDWSNLLIYNDDGMVSGSLSIGSDITNLENAYLQIHELKAELEKENLLLKGEPLPEWMQRDIIGSSKAMTYVIQKARQVAAANVTVLLEGETGVGKELFAEMIQRTGLRNRTPFVKVNCGALPAELIEDELFGHEKGAFTGALQSRKGRFELADGGTIFLDEIGELPLYMQPKLLRVLQNGEFERVGGQQTIKVNVRVIAATNRDLIKEVNEGRFRDDLFYRLNVFPITIPPLRSHKEDIPMLIRYFIDRKSKDHGKEFDDISKSDLEHLQHYDWPGNVRELANVIERAVVSSPNHKLKIDISSRGMPVSGLHIPSNASMDHIEREHIIKVLQDTKWRINGERGAAEILAMHPNTLRNRMKKLHITRKTNEPR